MKREDVRWLALAFCAVLSLSAFSSAFAQVQGGSLNPTTIPKYVTPLVIPPAMPTSTTSPAPAADYDIAVRQFKQQILPGGIWGSVFTDPTSTTGGTIGPFSATTIWSYGRAEDPAPDSSGILGGAAGVAPAQNSTFNYPAFTIENTTMLSTKVRWINDLVDGNGNYLPHLFNVDQTMHWANPPKANCVMMPDMRTDCETAVAAPYTGPVPLVTHVHGAHVQPHSDGYPEAWFLPGAPGTKGIPASYGDRGTHYTQADNTNTVAGSAFYSYENTQAATTLWYHDHALGMTRLNVYAGPAGFWLIRGGSFDTAAGVLPGPAPSVGGGDPNFSAAVRAAIREVPIAIQDRSFNNDGSLFYPADRSFFDGFTGPYIGGTGTPTGPSDISGIWNPEAFFNTMVVNGTTWPKFEVAPARYRLRLLNGCNSRTLNLSMFTVVSLGTGSIPGNADDSLGAPEIPFYQIGAEQGFLPNVVKIQTGLFTVLPGNGTIPAPVSAPSSTQALLMMPAERADVIVDFSGMPDGTRIRMINTAPDGPFGGFADPPADPLTSGQVMDFIVNSLLSQPTDTASTPVENLVLPVEAALGAATVTRQLSLNELMSDQVCVEIDPVAGTIVGTLFSRPAGDPNFVTDCAGALVNGNIREPMGPRQAKLGVLTTDGLGNVTAVPLKWADPITENPSLNSIEMWELYNTTVDAHPIHVHLVAFEVVDRQDLDTATLLPIPGTVTAPNPNELGYKDTVVAFPGQITRIKAKFDIAGLYVWHCHIVEHEDNEMMRPFVVTSVPIPWYNTGSGQVYVQTTDGAAITGSAIVWTEADTAWSIVGKGDFNGDTVGDYVWRNSTSGQVYVMLMSSTTAVSSGAVVWTEPDAAWRIVATGDLNGDRKSDLIWWNNATGQVLAMLMNNDAVSSNDIIWTEPDLNWKIVATGDLDGDGMDDLIWWNGSNGMVFAMLMNGLTVSSNAVIWTEPGVANWRIVGTGDLDGDGKADLVWRDRSTGMVFAMLMNGTTVSSSGVPWTEPDLNWEIVSIDKYSADNKADLLWRNKTTGLVFLLPMNGLAAASGGSVLWTEPSVAWRILGTTEWKNNVYGVGVVTP